MNQIKIERPFYAMASTNGTEAEITMYGEIVEQRPRDWFGNEVEGQFIIAEEFLEDLKQVEGCNAITIRMNSGGGDAGASIMIHNRLRDLSAKGVKLTCIVDGIAMSGGSLIMCACDTVKVNASSLIMIHKCWSFLFGGYNADEMRQMADANDAYDKAQAAIYVRKTGESETKILHMMADTTYMTGKEAFEKGFADEVLDEEPLQIAASADGRTLYVGQRAMHLAPGMFAPDSIPTVEAGAVPVETNTNQATEEGGKTMATTVEELRAESPELVSELEAAVRADATRAEQERLQGIDNIAGLFSADMVREAKYGKTACTAQELAFRAAQEAAKNGQTFLANLEADAQASGAGEVPAAPAPEDTPIEEPKTAEEKLEAARALVKKVKEEK
jgi:ATP-dependent protease ClpP protease subunit